MKKIITLLALAVTALCFTECKKGEDDPAISLRTRKARAAGEWRLVSGSAAYTAKGYNETYAFNGTDVRITSTLYYPVEGKYVLNLKIDKDGTFTFKETLLGATLEASGEWNFNKGGDEHKRKEDFIFTIDAVAKGNTSGLHFFNRLNTNFVYQIIELRNKRLVIHSAGTFYTSSNGDYSTLSTDYVFQQ